MKKIVAFLAVLAMLSPTALAQAQEDQENRGIGQQLSDFIQGISSSGRQFAQDVVGFIGRSNAAEKASQGLENAQRAIGLGNNPQEDDDEDEEEDQDDERPGNGNFPDFFPFN